MFHQYWVTVPIPYEQGSCGRAGQPRQSMDITAAVATVNALVPPNMSSLACNRRIPELDCAAIGVPTHLEETKGIFI